MKKKTLSEKQLKAFLVTFLLDYEQEYKSVAVIAYNKQEAGDTFAMWAHGKQLYAHIKGICVQPIRKTKRNGQMFTKTYYDKQNAFVNDLFEKVNTK